MDTRNLIAVKFKIDDESQFINDFVITDNDLISKPKPF